MLKQKVNLIYDTKNTFTPNKHDMTVKDNAKYTTEENLKGKTTTATTVYLAD